jgi:DNA invertase Pin-like site-specific DNA recombinase
MAIAAFNDIMAVFATLWLKAQRPVLQECLRYLRQGEVLVVTRLDRLARSLAHLSALDAQLKARAITLQVLDQAIDTTTPHGKMLFGMLAVFAEFDLYSAYYRKGWCGRVR